MTEHVHEWYLDWKGPEGNKILEGFCRGCSRNLTLFQVELRINAIEKAKLELKKLDDVFSSTQIIDA